jgi:hypothetical protein
MPRKRSASARHVCENSRYLPLALSGFRSAILSFHETYRIAVFEATNRKPDLQCSFTPAIGFAYDNRKSKILKTGRLHLNIIIPRTRSIVGELAILAGLQGGQFGPVLKNLDRCVCNRSARGVNDGPADAVDWLEWQFLATSCCACSSDRQQKNANNGGGEYSVHSKTRAKCPGYVTRVTCP